MPGALADRFRRHREEFLLAQELGCTPREARAELDRRAARARHKETDRRLRAKMNPAPLPASIHMSAAEPRAPWWRDI